MGSPALSHNMSYAAAQAMFYLVAGARRIQSLGEMEVMHARCSARISELERRVLELGDNLQRSEEKCQLLALEKTVTEDSRSALEVKVDSLTHVSKGLMIQVESLEHDIVDHDRVATVLQESVDAVCHDLDWLVRVSLLRSVEKLIEHPGFRNSMSFIRNSAFVVGAESIRNASMSVGLGDTAIGASPSGSSVSMSEALLSFASMDHAALFGLGDLDIQGIRELYTFSGSKGTPEVVAGHEEEAVQLGKDTVGADKHGAKH